MQAAFDAATAAYEAKDWQKAIDLFDALEGRLGSKASALVRASINLRRGVALSHAGLNERAARDLRSGIAAIVPDDPAMKVERIYAQSELTRVLLRQNDLTAAAAIAADLHQGEKTPAGRLGAALLGLRATMFDQGDVPVAYAAEIQSLAATMPELEKATRAEIDTLSARLMLNRRQNAEGFALLKKALLRQGGLDMRVSLAEVVTRSDLAIAALLNRKPEAAREYLAYTGQGRIAQSPFGSASSMDPPTCGGEGALAPDDLAVVEFGIDENGAVSYANTVYMSRPSSLGARIFATAVKGWSWRPEKIAKIPSFYKVLTRVELRCTNAVERRSFDAPLEDLIVDFVSRAASVIPDFRSDAAARPVVKAELARRIANPDDSLVAPLMVAVAVNDATSPEESAEMLKSALSRLPSTASIRLRAALAYRLACTQLTRRPDIDGCRARLRALLAEPAMAADPVVSGVLSLAIARAAYQQAPAHDAITLVQAVVDDPRLGDSDPLRTAALLQLANLQSAAENPEGASAAFARTGLSADQCALLDIPPAIDRTNVNSQSFPMEAQRWGFDGWVRLEQDVLPDGRANDTRAIIAYPPFVFRDAGVRAGSGIRYRATFRPGSTKGCTGIRQSIAFHHGD